MQSGDGRVFALGDLFADADIEACEEEGRAYRGRAAVGVERGAGAADATDSAEGGEGPELGVRGRGERVPEDDIDARGGVFFERLEDVGFAELPVEARAAVGAVS
jgi:hypothetical protein